MNLPTSFQLDTFSRRGLVGLNESKTEFTKGEFLLKTGRDQPSISISFDGHFDVTLLKSQKIIK